MNKQKKYRSTLIGEDAERYMSLLMGMEKVPNGSRSPDFKREDFDSRFLIELKTGIGDKSVLVDYELHYMIQAKSDFEKFFGDNFFNIDLKNDSCANYYAFLKRKNNFKIGDFDSEYSALKLSYSDCFFVPNELVFYLYAVSKSLREQRDIVETVGEMKEVVLRDLSKENKDYRKRKSNGKNIQNIHIKDISDIFNGGSGGNKKAKKRMLLLKKVYPEVEYLERFEIQGPNDSSFYILSEQCYKNIFDYQLREVVNKNIPLVEKITQERKGVENLLLKIGNVNQLCLFRHHEFGDFVESDYSRLSGDEMSKLTSLSKWKLP